MQLIQISFILIDCVELETSFGIHIMTLDQVPGWQPLCSICFNYDVHKRTFELIYGQELRTLEGFTHHLAFFL